MKTKKTLRMLQIKLKICYQNIKNKCKLNPFPRLIQIDYDRHVANSFFPVLSTCWDQFFFHLLRKKLGKPYGF